MCGRWACGEGCVRESVGVALSVLGAAGCSPVREMSFRERAACGKVSECAAVRKKALHPATAGCRA